MQQPYLSIVVTTRNDNHGGDLLKRTSCFVQGIYHQAQKFNVSVELIIVEWNPPHDKPLLKDVLVPPPADSGVSLRYIIVPEETHKVYKMAERIPLFQMTAKNVGIRRANGRFILCTNIDLLFSDQLFAFLNKQLLLKEVFYRANRVDVKADVLQESTFEAQIDCAKKNVITILGKGRGHEYLRNVPDFIYGFSNVSKLLNRLFKFFFKYYYPEKEFPMIDLDTAACGDFTLMSKEAWLKIEGYPELDLYSIHIDSMAIIAAKAAGYRQEILPLTMCAYHIYHEDGWGSFTDNPVGLIRFIEKRPGLDWASVYEAGKWLIANKKTWEINNADWGFSNIKFKEYIFQSGNPVREIN